MKVGQSWAASFYARTQPILGMPHASVFVAGCSQCGGFTVEATMTIGDLPGTSGGVGARLSGGVEFNGDFNLTVSYSVGPCAHGPPHSRRKVG